MKMKIRSHKHNINSPRSRLIANIRILCMMMLICIKQHLSNIWTLIHEKVKQRWSWIEKKSVLYIKKSVLVGTYFNESVFNPFFVPSWIRSCFCVNREKISFSRPDYVDYEIFIWRLTSLTGFYIRAHPLFKKIYFV